MAESWITLSADDVLAPENPERKVVATFKKRDDLADICAEVTEQIRQAYLLSNRDVGDDGTIPLGLRDRATALALWIFVSRGMPKNQAMQTPGREAAAKEAREYIGQILAVKVGVVTVPSVGTRTKTFSGTDQDGI